MAFLLGHCRKCGERQTTAHLPTQQKLAVLCGFLLANVGVMGAAFTELPEVASALDEKLEGICRELDREIDEIQQFGEAFDQ